MVLMLIATAVFFIKYLVAIYKKDSEKRRKNRIITFIGFCISFSLFCFMLWFSEKLPDSETESSDEPKTHVVNKKKAKSHKTSKKPESKPKAKKSSETKKDKKKKKSTTKKQVKQSEPKVKAKSKSKAKPKKKTVKPKISKAEKNGKAYEKAINKLNRGTVEYAKYDYKKNVLTYVGYDDMLTWKHSEFRKALPILETWALRMAPKYHIYTGKLRLNLVSENKTPIAHWTNNGDWQFDK